MIWLHVGLAETHWMNLDMQGAEWLMMGLLSGPCSQMPCLNNPGVVIGIDPNLIVVLLKDCTDYWLSQ